MMNHLTEVNSALFGGARPRGPSSAEDKFLKMSNVCDRCLTRNQLAAQPNGRPAVQLHQFQKGAELLQRSEMNQGPSSQDCDFVEKPVQKQLDHHFFCVCEVDPYNRKTSMIFYPVYRPQFSLVLAKMLAVTIKTKPTILFAVYLFYII